MRSIRKTIASFALAGALAVSMTPALAFAAQSTSKAKTPTLQSDQTDQPEQADQSEQAKDLVEWFEETDKKRPFPTLSFNEDKSVVTILLPFLLPSGTYELNHNLKIQAKLDEYAALVSNNDEHFGLAENANVTINLNGYTLEAYGLNGMTHTKSVSGGSAGPDGHGLDAYQEDLYAAGCSHAGILVPESSSLTIAGHGTLIAVGGKGANGGEGGDGGAGYASTQLWPFSDIYYGGGYGAGGIGGCGGSPGIGTCASPCNPTHHYASAPHPAGKLTFKPDAKDAISIKITGGASSKVAGKAGKPGNDCYADDFLGTAWGGGGGAGGGGGFGGSAPAYGSGAQAGTAGSPGQHGTDHRDHRQTPAKDLCGEDGVNGSDGTAQEYKVEKAPDASYAVEFYRQDQGTYYAGTGDEAEIREGEAGTTASVTDADKKHTFDGEGLEGRTFVLDEKAPNVTSAPIVNDQSKRTILKLFFKEQFTVTYEPGDHAAAGQEAVSKSGLDYGAKTPIAPEFKAEDGWHFAGWDQGVSDTVTGTVTYKALWARNGDTKYTIVYHFQADDNSYPDSMTRTDPKTGETDSDVFIPSTMLYKDWDVPYAGHWFDESHPQNHISDKIAGNGSTVLHAYFRNARSVTYLPGEHGTFSTKTFKHLAIGSRTPEFGGTPAAEPGYEFTSWNPEVAETVSNGPDGVYTAQYQPRTDTPYSVEVFYQAKGEYKDAPTLKLIGFTGTTDQPASAEEIAKYQTPMRAGYVLDTAKTGDLSAQAIKGNGSTTLKVYFKQQFSVTFDPGEHAAEGQEVQTVSGLDYGVTTPAAPEFKAEDGYVITGWQPEMAENVTEDAAYTAQWEPRSDILVTVKCVDRNGSAVLKTETIENQSLGAKVRIDAPTIDGYKNVDDGCQFITVKPDGNEVTFQYAKLVPVTYKPGDHAAAGSKDFETFALYGDPARTDAMFKGATDYHFTGWSPTPATEVTEEATYTAQWTFGHTWMTVKGTAAKVGFPGLTDGKKCSACGAWNPKQTVIAAKTPAPVKITSLKKSGKKATLKWKKSTSENATGYQIRYSTKKSMKNAKVIKVKSWKTYKKIIKKLKKSKRYYFQVRVYKNGKDAAGKAKTYYSKWSAKKRTK